MMINEKFLNLPPFISTTWEHVKALRMEGDILVITLIEEAFIKVPDLTPEVVVEVFEAHSKYMQKSLSQKPVPQRQEFPLRFGMTNMDGMQSALQHNPEQMGAPDLPREMLEKIAAISKIVSPEEMQGVPKPEPHCNCPHCQIARVINSELEGASPQEILPTHPENNGEKVQDGELVFEQWDIAQTGENLYIVKNKLDVEESYNVFLGDPVGCTCGRRGCEHVLAVLKS